MDKLWLRRPGSSEYVGPIPVPEIAERFQNGILSGEYEALEAAGQTRVTLNRATWSPLSALMPSSLLSPTSIPAAPAAADRSAMVPVIDRYRDAYRVGSALIGLATAVKVVGAILGIIVLLGIWAGGTVLSNQFGLGNPRSMASMSGNSMSLLTFVPGFLAACVIWLPTWICAVLIATQGQILRATLDTAVSSSHFLTNEERAQAMGLPASVVRVLSSHRA